MQRQAATEKGLTRRVQDLGLGQVPDPRQKRKVRHTLSSLLSALVAALVTKARSLRVVEQRTKEISARHGEWLGIEGRIADNTFGRLLSRVRVAALVACLHRLVKTEHRRGNLKPSVLRWGTIAIDGKNIATLRWHDLCRVLGVGPQSASFDEVREVLRERFPEAQLCRPQEGLPYALMRAHTVTLISAEASMCIHLRPIEGHTNEVGSMPELLEEVDAAYGRTGIFRVITTDAGNTSLGSAGKTVRLGYHYFGQIKSPNGEIHEEAVAALGEQRHGRAHATDSDKQNGHTATYYAWRYDLGDEGWLDWTHARQIVRIRRDVTDNVTGKLISTGNRYYVTSLTADSLSAQEALKLSRAHWRCENNTHWTADAELGEDRVQHTWSKHPHGVLVVAALRMMALAILAVARQLSCLGYTKEHPSWAQVATHFLLQLGAGSLVTSAFDDV